MADLIKVCSQSVIPSVDNTEPTCNELIKEDCVVATENRLVPIEINEGDSYKDIINAMLLEIKSLQDRVAVLEAFHP